MAIILATQVRSLWFFDPLFAILFACFVVFIWTLTGRGRLAGGLGALGASTGSRSHGLFTLVPALVCLFSTAVGASFAVYMRKLTGIVADPQTLNQVRGVAWPVWPEPCARLPCSPVIWLCVALSSRARCGCVSMLACGIAADPHRLQPQPQD